MSVLEALRREARESARMLRGQPAFAALSAATLALGIASSAGVFSVVQGILLKPLPYPSVDRIVVLWRTVPPIHGFHNDLNPWGKREYRMLVATARSFEALAAFKSSSLNLTGGEPERLDGIRVSSGFFGALGVAPAIGRVFDAAEDVPGKGRVAVLSHGLWRDRFGADAAAIGREVLLDGEAYTIVGVMPASFSFPRGEEMPDSLGFVRRPQIWIPLALPSDNTGPSDLAVVGRLARGVTLQRAQAELNLLSRRLDRDFPEHRGWWGSRAVGLEAQVVGDTRRPLSLLFGAACLVLLIAASNVTGLAMTRSLARRRELALRRSLGATRGHLAARCLADGFVLAGLGAALGVLGAAGCVGVLRAVGPVSVPRLREIAVDGPVLLFALAMTLLVGLVIGLVPLLAASGARLVETLKEGDERASGSRTGRRLQDAILVGEVAVALVLLIATGLLARRFAAMLEGDPGFDAGGVLTFQLTLPPTRYPDPDRMAQAYTQALAALRSIPGVSSAGLASAVPMGGAPDGTTIRIPGRPSENDVERPQANYLFASPGFFAAVGSRLRRGREFSETDTLASAPVTIVNQAMADRYWPSLDPIGRQVGVTDTRWPVRTIVGVVADVKRYSLRETPAPEMYVPYTQNDIRNFPSMGTLQVAVRTTTSPDAAVSSVRRAIHSVDSDLPIARLATLTRLVDESTAAERFSVGALATFGGVALLLAVIGLYGVVSYSVVRRTHEIGVRMALGATRGHIFAMIVGQGSRLAATGIAIGLGAAAGATRLMAGFLHGTRPTDQATFVGVPLLLLAVAVFACFIPALRATSVDPQVALRRD